MQNGPAYASEAPGKCGEYQERHHIDPEGLVYIRFGLTGQLDIVICRGTSFLSAQVIAPLLDDGIARRLCSLPTTGSVDEKHRSGSVIGCHPPRCPHPSQPSQDRRNSRRRIRKLVDSIGRNMRPLLPSGPALAGTIRAACLKSTSFPFLPVCGFWSWGAEGEICWRRRSRHTATASIFRAS